MTSRFEMMTGEFIDELSKSSGGRNLLSALDLAVEGKEIPDDVRIMLEQSRLMQSNGEVHPSVRWKVRAVLGKLAVPLLS